MKKLLLLLATSSLLLVQSCKKDNINIAKPGLTESNKKTNTITFSVSKVLGSNMVVQRDKPFIVWGQALAGHTVTVKASWHTATYTAVADANGNWETTVSSVSTITTPQNLVVKDNGASDITLTNILVGDVWVCSGQSNMAMPMKKVNDDFNGFNGVDNYTAEIAAANYPNIRLSAIPYGRPGTPQDYLTANAPWTVCSPTTAGDYSAIAYYFGRKLNTTLNVPIGLVVSDLSATACQEWTSLATINANGYLNAFYGAYPNVSTLYNGMIYPLRKLAIKGFIWDQGEGNYNDYPGMYTYLVSAMVGNWRTIFNQGDVPFYLSGKTALITGYPTDTVTTIPRFREYQNSALGITPNTALSVNTDNNTAFNIHSIYKQPVGERLAFLALNKTYGQASVVCDGPKYLSYTVNGTTQVVINFVSGTATGLTTVGGSALLQVFYVAGTDYVFRQAQAVIYGNVISLAIPAGTPLPIKAVRHCFTNAKTTNLINSAGLPASSFRSDNW